MKAIITRDIRKVKRKVLKSSGSTSKKIFKNSSMIHVPKTDQNRILASIATVKSLPKKASIDKYCIHLGIGWEDIKFVLFTDEIRATLDVSDGWPKRWVGIGEKIHHHFCRHQDGSGVMPSRGIINGGRKAPNKRMTSGENSLPKKV